MQQFTESANKVNKILTQEKALKVAPHCYEQIKDTFEIILTLEPQKLNIVLKDFTCSALFQKQYTNADIGKSITKKIDLQDIFNSFSLAKDQNQAEKVLQSNDKYKFGQIVRDKNNIPCYKIQSDGRITVYVQRVMTILKKQVFIECQLKLTKTRNLSQLQKPKDYSKQLQNVQKINLQQIFDKVNQINQLKQRIISLENKPQVHNCHKRQFLNMLSQYSLVKRTLGLDKILPPLQGFAHKFKISNNRIRLEQKDQQDLIYFQFIFQMQIPVDKPFKFRIRIKKTTTRSIMIGVVDYEKQKTKKYSHDSQNCVCYLGKDGTIFPQAKKQGQGFKQQQVVQIYVDRRKGLVKWLVNGNKRAEAKSNILCQNDRKFHPFVQLYNRGDEIQWAESHNNL